MSRGIPYFSKPPECSEPKKHETTYEGKGKCRGLKFKGVSGMVLSMGVKLNRVLLSWALKDTSQDLSNIKFFVYRGESPEELELLNKEGISATTGIPEYIDVTANLLDFHKRYVYQIRAVEFNTKGEPTQTSFSWMFEVDGIEDKTSLYIITEHCFLYRHTAAGVPIMVFKKMHDGVNCPECWDKVLKRVTKSTCLTCAGTGQLKGYYNPIEGWMGLDPNPDVSQVTVSGENQPNLSRFQFTNYPLIHVGDIIVEMKTNNFWKVADVRFPQRNRVLFLQTGTIDGINRSDVEYKALEIPEDRRRALVALLDEKMAGDAI